MKGFDHSDLVLLELDLELLNLCYDTVYLFLVPFDSLRGL